MLIITVIHYRLNDFINKYFKTTMILSKVYDFVLITVCQGFVCFVYLFIFLINVEI